MARGSKLVKGLGVDDVDDWLRVECTSQRRSVHKREFVDLDARVSVVRRDERTISVGERVEVGSDASARGGTAGP